MKRIEVKKKKKLDVASNRSKLCKCVSAITFFVCYGPKFFFLFLFVCSLDSVSFFFLSLALPPLLLVCGLARSAGGLSWSYWSRMYSVATMSHAVGMAWWYSYSVVDCVNINIYSKKLLFISNEYSNWTIGFDKSDKIDYLLESSTVRRTQTNNNNNSKMVVLHQFKDATPLYFTLKRDITFLTWKEWIIRFCGRGGANERRLN